VVEQKMSVYLNKTFMNRTLLMRMFIPFTIVMYFCLVVLNAHAEIKSSHQSGNVTFSGQHAGMNFEGNFERWEATLILPPQNNPSITATFYMGYAKTGDSIYDSTLPEFDWFDVENHPQGKFVSTQISITEDGYRVWGDLTLKNITNPANFMLVDDGDKLRASFDINRLAYQIGTESDPEAEWVSKTISISMLIK
jgi:polyisoprenoid-binding protein YceI